MLNNLTDPYFCETCKRLTLLLPKIESWALKEVFSICFCFCSSFILYYSFSSFFEARAHSLLWGNSHSCFKTIRNNDIVIVVVIVVVVEKYVLLLLFLLHCVSMFVFLLLYYILMLILLCLGCCCIVMCLCLYFFVVVVYVYDFLLKMHLLLQTSLTCTCSTLGNDGKEIHKNFVSSIF